MSWRALDWAPVPAARAVRTVVALAGSLRRGSFNRGLLAAAAELAPRGVSIELESGLGALPWFDEDLERATAGGPEAVRGLRARVAAADGLLVATPEYNHSFPGALKNAIDWLSRPAPDDVLAAMPVALLGASAGPWGTRLAQAALRQVLYSVGALVLPGPAFYLADAARHFDKSGRLADRASRDRLAALVVAFACWMDRVAPPSAPQRAAGPRG